MAAILRAPDQAEPRIPHPSDSAEPRNPIALLASLHAEAAETARLANLLGRSRHAAIALAAMCALTLALRGANLAESATWAGFILVAAGAIALAYRRTIGQAFERAALKSFSQDLDAILVFAGFAWGAGAFLALPANADTGLAVLFSSGACMTVAIVLRQRDAAFLFLAPVAALASFACVLRPLSGGALAAALVLIACGAVAATAALAERSSRTRRDIAELAGLPFV